MLEQPHMNAMTASCQVASDTMRLQDKDKIVI